MIKTKDRHYTINSIVGLSAILAALIFTVSCSQAPPPVTPTTPPELTALMERAAIQDLFNDYYSQFGPSGQHNFMAFFTPDGVLEVNGLVAKGVDQIKALYVQAGVGGEKKEKKANNAAPEGISEMMYTNLKIELQGDKAVATLLWHSVKSDLLTTAPKVTEYGTERTELVKQDGRWLISKRVILSEGGMPEGELKSYPKR
jgi:hypothetical protein